MTVLGLWTQTRPLPRWDPLTVLIYPPWHNTELRIIDLMSLFWSLRQAKFSQIWG